MNREDIKHAIMNVEEFPTLSVVVTKIIQVCEDENSHINDLVKIISHDQSIAARILKLANSAYYGYLRKVNTMSKAITILGFNTIRSLSISASVFDTFKKIKNNYNFNRCQFWLHSIGVGTISKMVAQHVGYKDIEVAFLNGLLHDIGKLFFESYYTTQYEDVMKEVVVNRCLVLDAELKLLGVEHSEVGGWLTHRWKFPEELVLPIQFHHNVSECPEEHRLVASIVHVADHLCRVHSIGSGGDSLIPDVDPMAMQILGIDENGLVSLNENVAGEKENIFTFMAIMD